ncbi:PKD domain-containing protein, partial [Candidatus Bipolaricaulota bacterium]|nr:PKD domain-containing protein [Candidatus Bipolaricaulota bacterium]
MKKRTAIVFALIALIALVGVAALAQGVPAPKGIVIKPPDTPGLTAQVWVDKGAYTIGEKIQVHFSVNQDAFVYIYDIDAAGKVSLLFPNYYSQNNRVSAGEHVLPDSPSYNLTVVQPTGTEYLQLIASAVPLNVTPQFQITAPFPLMGSDPDAFKLQLQGQLMGVVPDPQWGEDWTSFDVVSGYAPEYGTVIINSAPSGAWITVDGTFVGYTPRSLYVSQGYHQLTVGKDGYASYNRGVFVIGNHTRTFNITLNPLAPVNQPPTAAFSFTPTNPIAGGWVQFNASASSDNDGTISSYAWNFGDGTTSSGMTRYHQFAAPGTYTVVLTVTDNDGATNTVSHTVQVGTTNQPPTAAFSFTPTNPIAGGWVQFNASASSDNDGTISSYAWNFGDGTTSSGMTRYHQFAAPGTYTVVLTVTDNDGATNTVSHTVQVGTTNQPPTAAFDFTPASPSVGEWVRFDGSSSFDGDGSIASYLWNFGDGSATGSGVVVYHKFNAAGTYNVVLTVMDNDGASDTQSHALQVGPTNQPPVAAFNYSPLAPAVGENIILNASPSYDSDGTISSYAWDLDNNGTTDATNQAISVTYYDVGPHPVRLTVTDNNGLSSSTTQVINVGVSGVPGQPAMGNTPGIFVWGTDTWHITVNAGAG